MTKPQTITITNFSGRLTRIINGDLNSGFAKFKTSYGYDPFSKPLNLTWASSPTSIVSGISDTWLAAKTRFEIDTQYVYAVGSSGKIYRTQPNTINNPNLNSVIGIGSVAVNSPTFNYGASIDFFGNPANVYVGSDGQINSLPVSSIGAGFAGDAVVGSAANYTVNTGRSLKQFQGKLAFGNGITFGLIGSTNTVVSSIRGVAVGGNIYSEIDPQLGNENYVRDMDVSPDYNYLLLTTSTVRPENILTVAQDRQTAAGGEGNLFQWNGTDGTVTAGTSVPSQILTALQTYLQRNIFFGNDAFGLTVSDGTQKILGLPNNKSPLPYATGVNGNFTHWASVETDIDNNKMYCSLYYFGQLDHENPTGLYRLLRFNTTLTDGFVYQVPVNILVNNNYDTVNNAITTVQNLGYGKHYISAREINASTTANKLYSFVVSPDDTLTPQLGVYETQTQLFSKRIDVKQIRVYTEPVVAGNAFTLEMIGSDGEVLTNGTYTYTFGDPVDANERINFNPNASTGYALGIRITNTGTTNMTVKKIEVDWDQQGK